MLQSAVDQQVGQTFFSTQAAFYAAESAADLARASGRPALGAELQKSLIKNSQKDFSKNPIILEANQGVTAKAVHTTASLDPSPQLATFHQSSGEIFLQALPPDKNMDAIRLECGLKASSQACPELLLEWFELKSGFVFADLKTLLASSRFQVISGCLDLPIGIKRCVSTSSFITSSDLSVNSGGSDSNFNSIIRLATRFETGSDYLFHFRSLDAKAFDFRLSGERAGKAVPLPLLEEESSALGKSAQSFAQITDQHLVSGGLQDVLDFAHYAEEAGAK